jgi:hypothetical protein
MDNNSEPRTSGTGQRKSLAELAREDPAKYGHLLHKRAIPDVKPKKKPNLEKPGRPSAPRAPKESRLKLSPKMIVIVLLSIAALVYLVLNWGEIRKLF